MAGVADFVLDFCRASGGVVDPPAYGAYEVLLPDAIAASLGIAPYQRFAFDEAGDSPGAIRLAHGHPLVERMAELARAVPASARFYINDVRLDKSGLALLARAALSFPNANLVEVPDAIETRMMFHYVRFNFKASLISDEKREQLVSVLMNAQTGARVEDFSTAEAHRLAETPAFAHLPVAPAGGTEGLDPLAPERLRALLDRASLGALDSLAGAVAALRARAERLLELDRARLDAYYAELESDLRGRFDRAEEDVRRASLESRLAATRADHTAKLADAEAKYGLRVELDLLNLAVIAQPKLALTVRLENRQTNVPRTVVYDPLRRRIEPIPCEVCARPEATLLLCANGHLAGDDCLAPQCVDCKRVFCRSCTAELTACAVCDRPVCQKSLSRCRECGRGTCREHANLCHAADGQPMKSGFGAAAQVEAVLAPPAEPPSPPRPAPVARSRPPAPAKRPAPRPKKRPRPPAPDPGYRLQVQIEKEEPLVTAFVLRKGGREVAQRLWELTESGIAVTCWCEKGLKCSAQRMTLRPEPAAQIEAQLESEIARLRAEYRIPAHRTTRVAKVHGDLTRVPVLRLRGPWKDEAVLSAARAAFDGAHAPGASPEPGIDLPDWVLTFAPGEAERFLPDIERFARIAYGWLWYEGVLKAGELAELAASLARPMEWFSPQRARDLFKADPVFRHARGQVVFIDPVSHPLKVLKEKQALGLPPRAFTAEALLAAAAGPLPLTPREEEIERELNRNISSRLSVRSLQRLIGITSHPGQIAPAILNLCRPRDLDEAKHFAQLIKELWNRTPRYELRGRTPEEVAKRQPRLP